MRSPDKKKRNYVDNSNRISRIRTLCMHAYNVNFRLLVYEQGVVQHKIQQNVKETACVYSLVETHNNICLRVSCTGNNSEDMAISHEKLDILTDICSPADIKQFVWKLLLFCDF